MAWRKYGNGDYYYRTVRNGDTTTSEYVGSGLHAELAAALDEAERQQRQARIERDRRERRRQNEIERELNKIDDAIKNLVDAVMVATGHRAHKRQWRKKRQ